MFTTHYIGDSGGNNVAFEAMFLLKELFDEEGKGDAIARGELLHGLFGCHVVGKVGEGGEGTVCVALMEGIS